MGVLSAGEGMERKNIPDHRYYVTKNMEAGCRKVQSVLREDKCG